MRNVCQLDVLVGARDKNNPPGDFSKRILEAVPMCRVLTVTASGPRFSITLLLPEVPGGYSDLGELTGLLKTALAGKGVVVASVHSLREATPVEVLGRVLSKRS